ncbi:hypothetical protein cpbgf_40023 [Cryptosporidium parvum]|uniref:Uncharacterized protein n=1 Tax=Cryptosporidium parvum TaxID=5807 RepID=A0A7S7LH46_CRYPV|nr:hypothetical protein CPATCC_0017110 [Cryptosporidium parvum]WKS77189.1 hypothetical protein CPCDC_4g25 [Cryptosporidium sp. 43IA8]WRK32140.1 hypothetical protein cpbgf_40023 [Cryptosporidium parvum]|eukprot:QOY41888.1 hypothetical protein CPATCC_001474 [Cryptosporidium parvum]
MKTFNFAKLVFIFAIVALFGNFRNTEYEVSTVSFEQSFVRLKLRKPLSKEDKRGLENGLKTLEQKRAQAQLSGNQDKVAFYDDQIKKAKQKLGRK